MADKTGKQGTDPNADPSGEQQEGEPEDEQAGTPEPEPVKKGGKSGKGSGKGGGEGDDAAQLKQKVAALTEMLEKQQSIIKKFQSLGDESPPPKTDAERIAELEATLSILSQKIEGEQKAKAEAAQKEREEKVNAFLEEQPQFEDQRETLMKADESVLGLIMQQKARETASPISRIGAPVGIDWNKKIAAAAERRKKRHEARDALNY